MLLRASTLGKIVGACVSQSLVGSRRLQSVGHSPALSVCSFPHQITHRHPAFLRLNIMNTEKSKSIEGKTATIKSPSKRNKNYVSQDEGTRRGSKRNKNCTSQDDSTRKGPQRNKGYTTQDEDTKSASMRNKSSTAKDEDTKSAVVKTNIRDSDNKCTEALGTFSRTLIASQNKHIVTRSVTVKSTIVSTQKECTDTSMKNTVIDSQSEHSTTRSASTKSQTRGYHSQHSTTRSASTKSQTRGYHSQHNTSRSALTKSQTRSRVGESIEAKSATIKSIICGLQNDTIRTQGQTTKRTTRGSPRKETVTKDTPSKRKHHGSESGGQCASTGSMDNKPGDAPLKNKGDPRTCSVTQEHPQLEEGEIISNDGESSPHTRHPGGRKRRRRSYKSHCNASTTASMPKKCIDKVEIVDLQPEGYTFRDGKHGQKLMQHRSTGGGRQQTANTPPGDVPLKNKEDSRTCSETQEHSQLEEGEINDGGSSPHTRHPGGRKRRRRSYKSCNGPMTASTPKKFIDKVEIVDLRPEGYTFRDGKHGHKLRKHRSTGGGRQQTANIPSSIDTCSARACMKTSNVATCKPGTVRRSKAGEMKRLRVASSDKCAAAAVALEEGEIPSDSDVPGNVSTSEVLPQSGSDMSISSEDSGLEKSAPTTEHTDSHVCREGPGLQDNSYLGNTRMTSTTAEPPGSSLDPLAAAFVPRASTSAVSGLTQHANTTDTSELAQTSSTHPHNQPWPTFIAQSHFAQRESQFRPRYPTRDYFPQMPGLDSGLAHGYITHPDPNSSFPAPYGGMFNSASSIWSYIRLPQSWSQPVRGPFLQPPLSGPPGSDLWGPASMGLGGESGGQTSPRRIRLCPTADHSCPEIRNSSRCWQAVGHTEVHAGSMEVTVMCYNILSQQLMDRHMHLYDRCPEANLEWSNRGAALLTQIIAHNADIVCLQEVEHDDWMQDIRDTLAEHGYVGVYKKQSGDNTHGCAILFKGSQFLQLKAVPVQYMRGGILDRHNVGLILLLQPQPHVYAGSVQKICVATTHLLFNPRRGDVKLAQLMLLLAEIDKHAYLDDRPDIGQCMQSAHKCCPDSDCSHLDQVEPPQSGHSPEIDKDAGCKCEPALQASARPHSAHYCPIILCGDFNSEPFCDLYKFISTGYLKYDDCICRLLCGQEEGRWGGTDRLVDRQLLPVGLNICESCQYLHVLTERQNRGAAGGRQPISRVNSGQVWHRMNFKSVYNHFVGKGHRNREISTYHNNCCCTVDYLFYSQSAASCSQSLMPGSDSGDSTATQLGDSQSDVPQGDKDTHVGSVDIQDRGMAAGSADIHKDTETCQQPLELVARYTLLTQNELTKFGYMPNSVFPSDHLCLIAKFVLR